MVVLEIKETSKGRYLLRLDGGEDIVLYRGEIKQHNIVQGEDLSQEQYDTLLDEVLRPRCRKYALHILEKRERTRSQLKQKLREKGYMEILAEDAVCYCEGYGYINDKSYAERYVRTYQNVKSDTQLKNALYQKGIAKDLIEAALSERMQDERELIRRLLKKRGYEPFHTDKKEQQKLYRYLLGKGFAFEDIRNVMALWEE